MDVVGGGRRMAVGARTAGLARLVLDNTTTAALHQFGLGVRQSGEFQHFYWRIEWLGISPLMFYLTD